MANQKTAAALKQATSDEQFKKWLKKIGQEGLKQIQELLLKTAQQNQELAAMVKEDPENTMVLFAYEVYKQEVKKNKEQATQSTEPENVQYDDSLEDMNNPPLSSPISAKTGAKLNHIAYLNGHCPEGYEMQYYRVGGTVCKKCAKKKEALLQSMACGGKKRIKKGQGGLQFDPKRMYEIADFNKRRLEEMGRQRASGELYERKKTLDTFLEQLKQNTTNAAKQRLNKLYRPLPDMQKVEPQNNPTLEQELLSAPDKAARDSIMRAWGMFKKGGKTLTKAKANSLKYKGGPGDINSTEGMKPNKKQRRMLCKKIGGMVNNAKKITIYQQPGMIDYVKLN